MITSRIALVLAAFGLGLAGLAVKGSLDATTQAAVNATSARECARALTGLQEELAALRADLVHDAPVPAAAPVRDAALERRVAALEEGLAAARAELASAAAAPASARNAPVAQPAQEVEYAASELARLQALVLGSGATPEEEARFWELARTSDVLPDLIRSLQSRVEQSPRDIDARLTLAQAFVAKLYTVPDGPERGAWAVRAEDEWRHVLEIEDTNWEARYGLATSLSGWPAMFGKTPEAIRHLEILRQQQELDSPRPHHAQVYLQLAALHRREGNADRAREVLRAGLERFPGSEVLQAAAGEGR